ncbi:sugar transferase [Aliiroseovarius sp. KMU-50]|uniref:Sugar transferase n=1 Tax=Aliiroseovarius salicola TaxID=3009082 RepID=A0ABT4W2A2_9RHOB|nr:sugar transferase [Aliiroseovarius sp. KMU-50]MDA5094649.1 sugar transferase [Aliiroseovarius sp. KMU-50]
MTVEYRRFHNQISHRQISHRDAVEDLPKPEAGYYSRFGKRVLDIFIVLVSLPLVLPIIAISACVVMLDGSNPFYAQKRVGRGNKVFWMWKLRSMVPNAKETLSRVLNKDRAARLEWEKNQKLKNDPRITWFGHYIRKFSVDELPQIWNVLRGEMSIVGPRPMMPEQRSLYPGRSYYRFRPGLTGFWQVSDRNESSFAARSDHDRKYAKRVSIKTDILVILSTVKVVLHGTGY